MATAGTTELQTAIRAAVRMVNALKKAGTEPHHTEATRNAIEHHVDTFEQAITSLKPYVDAETPEGEPQGETKAEGQDA